MYSIIELTYKTLKFRDAPDWIQFHYPKAIALSLLLEAMEVLEHFQWKNDKEIAILLKENGIDLSDKLMAILYCIFMSNNININIIETIDKKIHKNSKKYPVEKVIGSAMKYTEL